MKIGGIMDFKELYETNADFREYVDRYCCNKTITPEEAIKYSWIQLVGQHYRKVEEELKNARVI